MVQTLKPYPQFYCFFADAIRNFTAFLRIYLYNIQLCISMERKIDKVLRDWRRQDGHKALLLRGPRQVGKSYAIRRLGAEYYNSIIEMNFETNPEYKAIFEGDLSADSIYEKINFAFHGCSLEGALLFLDEIQSCKNAFSALKPLVEDGRCDIACSGSVLSEIVGDIGFIPVGSVDLKYMGPMDFEEFLWAMGFSSTQTETIHKHISDMEPFETFILRQLNDLFKRFLVIGGMPASVSAYARTHMYTDSYNEQEYILKLLSMDIEKYISDQTDKVRINQCLESIPRQLSREKNASFLYSDVLIKSKYGQREYGSAIKWLDGAGVIDLCYNIEEISEPFEIKTDGNIFKIYMKDTGLLVHKLGPAVANGIVEGDFTINNGAVIENSILETLIRKGYKVHYYSSSTRRMELDCVFNYNGRLAVMEIKSCRKKSAKSLNKALVEDKAIDVAIKVSDSNISIDENGVYHYPLFGPSFFDDCQVLELSPMNYLEDLKARLS